jgi:hypothetical protein
VKAINSTQKDTADASPVPYSDVATADSDIASGAEVGMSPSSVFCIFNKHLVMWNICANWIPHALSLFLSTTSFHL